MGRRERRLIELYLLAIELASECTGEELMQIKTEADSQLVWKSDNVQCFIESFLKETIALSERRNVPEGRQPDSRANFNNQDQYS